MGKIFEALYGNQRDAATESDGVAETEQSVVVRSEAEVEQPQDAPDSQPVSEVRNIALPRSVNKKTNDKWKRDLKKVASNLIVTVDNEQNGGKVVMFTGMEAKVGVSTVVESISDILASEYDRHRVLILDFSPYGGPRNNNDTLLEVLDSDLDPVTFIAEHSKDEVTRISVGATKESLVVQNASNQLRDFVVEARKHYDWILFDVPPFNLTPFSDSLGRIADGVALVVNSGVTRVPALNAIEEDMSQLGINLVGIVLNFRKYPLPRRLLRFL